jgi:hypothetical protein
MQSIHGRLMRLERYLPHGMLDFEFPSSNNSSNMYLHPPSLRPSSLPTSLSSDDAPSSIQQYLTALVNAICHSEGTKITEEDIYATYFEYINKWLPIISQKRFCQQLGGNGRMVRRSETDLLLACMYLLVREPCTLDSRGEIDIYYRSTRYAYFILQAESLGSIELAQSGLMLATYEHASGLIEQAYTTIWACARMMYSLRLQEICRTKINCDDYDQTECAEAHSLWWAILIRDR